MNQIDDFSLRPKGGNLAQGMVEVGSVAILGAVCSAALLVDRGAPITLVIGVPTSLAAVGLLIIIRRYVPMCVTIDPEADEIRFRNAWRSGSLRWSHVDTFEPSEMLMGYAVAKARLHDGRRIKIRAAPYAKFVGLLNEFGSTGPGDNVNHDGGDHGYRPG